MSDIRIHEIKQRARNDLSGRWGNAVLVTIVLLLLSFLAALVPLGSIFIAGPMAIGYAVYFVSLVRKQELSVNLLFSPFNKYGNALLTFFLRALIVGVAASPVIIYMVVYFLIHSNDLDTLSFGHVFGFSLTMLILLLIPVYVGLRLGLMYYIVADNVEVPGDKAVEISWKMMAGHEWDLFLLVLSFILWYLLGVLTFGLAFLWMMPYYSASVAHFYFELKQRNREYAQIIDSYGHRDIPGEPINELFINE